MQNLFCKSTGSVSLYGIVTLHRLCESRRTVDSIATLRFWKGIMLSARSSRDSGSLYPLVVSSNLVDSRHAKVRSHAIGALPPMKLKTEPRFNVERYLLR